MQKHDREQLNTQNQRNYIFLRFCRGCKAVVTDWKRAIVFATYAIGVGWAINIAILRQLFNELSTATVAGILRNTDLWELLEQVLPHLGLTLGAPLGAVALLVVLGTPFGSKGIRDSLLRIGLDNHAGEAPLLIGKTRSEKDKRVEILEFVTYGLPLKKWEDMKLEIEATLNLNIVKVETGESKHRVLLHTIPPKHGLPGKIDWDDNYLITNHESGFMLVLGIGLSGKEIVDLARTPHILLGGSTGSGKSVLLKLLLMECWKKGATVIIADFKGGVDFPSIWHKHCEIIIDEQELLTKLDELTQELEHRKKLLTDSGCSNIDEYNMFCRETAQEKLPRLIFACDEVAELLDKTGLDKEQKALVTNIESRIAKIARLGRAFGIHLILATQRPDANVLSGQIKNNLDYRACGRADNTLSIIILDNGSASDQIPSDSQGRFINREGLVFQAYWLDDKTAFDKQGRR